MEVKYPVDEQRIILAGFSGGARMAYYFAVKYKVKGLLMCGSGSRNNDPNAKEFGYYFISEDYVKLKMMSFTVHKDAVNDLLKKS